MPHHYFYSFAGKDQLFRELMTDGSIINITIHAFERFKRLQLFCYGRPKITGMPDLIAVGKMPENCFIQKTMGVGNQADTGHGIKIIQIGAVMILL